MTGATELELIALDPSEYLTGDDVIDVDHPSIQAQAAELRAGHPDDVDFARAAFEHVRDEVRHSMDARDPRVTLTASEVLAQGVGLCYAKSHLLTALLRAEGIPAGLCYQAFTDDGESYTLHGLVAVHLRGGWHRQDPRGNKAGVDAQFRLDAEQLAWPVDARRGERDYPQVHVRPSVNVVRALRRATDVLVLAGGGLPSEP